MGRTFAVVVCQVVWQWAAAATARRVSAGPRSGTEPTTSSVAGLVTSNVAPSSASVHRPATSAWLLSRDRRRALPRTCGQHTSRVRGPQTHLTVPLHTSHLQSVVGTSITPIDNDYLSRYRRYRFFKFSVIDGMMRGHWSRYSNSECQLCL